MCVMFQTCQVNYQITEISKLSYSLGTVEIFEREEFFKLTLLMVCCNLGHHLPFVRGFLNCF